MGTRFTGAGLTAAAAFLRESAFTTPNFRGSGATLTSAAASAAVVPAATAFTSGMLAGMLLLGCSCGLVLERLPLPPEVDFDLAMFGYSLHIPRFMNESNCSTNHMHSSRNV